MRIITSKTLLLLIMVCMLPMLSMTDYNYSLHEAENLLDKQYKRTLNAARAIDLAHAKMDSLEDKYNTSQSAISAANRQTVASAFGVTVTAFATGGASVAWSAIISAVTSGMTSEAEKRAALTAFGGMSLVDAYSSAIEDKKSAIDNFNGQFVNYQINWQVWYAVYNSHYNLDTHDGASSGSERTTHNTYDFVSNWQIDKSLPALFDCGGSCGQSFPTPRGEHATKCGSASLTMYEDVKKRSKTPGNNAMTAVKAVNKERWANPALGCAEPYYTCEELEYHMLRNCDVDVSGYNDKLQIITEKCGLPYRRCLLGRGSHRKIGSGTDDVTQNPAPPPSPPPTPAPSTPTYHACGVHETSVSGDHSWIYRDCPSGHAHYACDGSNHSVQATCSETNANGDSCTVTGFYACQTHTHQFPDPNLCPAAGCNVRINTANAADHALVTCTGNVGKSCRQQYYACQANAHRWVRCQRGVSCPSYTHGSGINRSAYMTRACMPNPNTCITVNGQRQKHDLQ